MTTPELPFKFNVAGLSAPLKAYVQGGMQTVEGWGIDDDLVRLFLALDAGQLEEGITGNLLEIGVHHGRTFILLALMARTGEFSFAIDLFEQQARNLDRSGRGDSTAFATNMRRHAPGVPYEVVVGDSLFLDFESAGITRLRFVHVDGAHYVDAVVSDLVKVQQRVVPGGIVVVDDFLHSGFPGVGEGCHRYLLYATPRLLVPFAIGKNKLFLTTHSHRETWFSLLSSGFLAPAGRPVQLHGFDAVCVDTH
jgi:SAM-dependent methyltransferase